MKIILMMLLLFNSVSAIAAEVEFRTNKGKILIDVDEEKAPITSRNFIGYVEDGFFDGLIFHRVIPNFVIQGGGFEPGLKKRPTKAPIALEDNGLKNKKYTLSMARTQNPNSATSQFFINLVDNRNLDKSANNPGYAVFGEVTKGMEVVDAIAKVPTGTVGGYRDVPQQDIIIEKAIVVQ